MFRGSDRNVSVYLQNDCRRDDGYNYSDEDVWKLWRCAEIMSLHSDRDWQCMHILRVNSDGGRQSEKIWVFASKQIRQKIRIVMMSRVIT